MDEKRNILSKVLGRTDIIAIGFGTMVGWSWIMMAAAWVNEAGFLGAITAFIIGGMIILLIGLTYGELTAALPLAGGEFVYTYRAIGGKFAWFVGWIMTLAYIGVAAWEGIALATAIDYLLPISASMPIWEVAGYQVYFSWSAVGMVGAILMTVLNYMGIRPAVLFQVMATAALFVVVLILFFGSIAFGDISNAGKMFTTFDGFSYVFLMVPAMMIGFDVIPQSAEEMNIAPKNIGRMVLVCIFMSLFWYILLICGVSMAAPVEIRGSGMIPVAEIAAYLFNGEIFSVIMIFGGIFGILTSWNGFFMGATRLLFAMGRARILPGVFGRIHSKYKTPWAATIFVGAICIVAPIFGRNALVWFMDTSSMCSLIAYIFVVLSFIILKSKEPDLHRPFEVRGGIPFGIFVLIITVSYFILYLRDNFRMESLSPEFLITAGWVVIGVLFTYAAGGLRKLNIAENRELLIFGEKFARKGVNNEI